MMHAGRKSDGEEPKGGDSPSHRETGNRPYWRPERGKGKGKRKHAVGGVGS